MSLNTFEERFEYCKTASKIGVPTFGNQRYLNQYLYNTPEWRRFRNKIINRDSDGDYVYDLGFIDDNHIIPNRATVHHLNPITIEDVVNRNPIIFDPENVITVWEITHKALHFGDISILPKPEVERKRNDTCPWRK